MDVHPDHEHFFATHEDPRWVVCDCGQYAVWTRNTFGEPSLRLIDAPRPRFPALTSRDQIPLGGQCTASIGRAEGKEDPELAPVQGRRS